MSANIYRYTFNASTCIECVEIALLLATWGTQSLHGEAAARLEAAYLFDREQRICIVDADSEPGRDFNRLFCGFLARELESDGFRVRRIRNSRSRADRRSMSTDHGRC